ncbi:MAG: hypothetical protein DRP09_20705 [Candidatus Thorarchaeota archaeon]|nr:MAG: hypothetical protein DRP09_20705 [Candidatus Thorarchaeota archaeon]
MDHSRKAIKSFLVYALEPHNVKLESNPSPAGGIPLIVRDLPIDLQWKENSAPTRDRELMII